MRGNALARTRLPRGSPTRLRQIFFSGTCLSNTCFMFVLLSDVLGTRALFIFFATCVLCLFHLHRLIQDLFIFLSTKF